LKDRSTDDTRVWHFLRGTLDLPGVKTGLQWQSAGIPDTRGHEEQKYESLLSIFCDEWTRETAKPFPTKSLVLLLRFDLFVESGGKIFARRTTSPGTPDPCIANAS